MQDKTSVSSGGPASSESAASLPLALSGVASDAQAIKNRIVKVEGRDFLGTERGDLIDFLPFEDAKQYLKPETTAEQWAAREVKPPLVQAREYLDFAWDKANNCRGLSAGRSLNHLSAWLWLGGFGGIVDAHFCDYERYGKFQLVIASELLGFDWRAHDDGEWVNDEGGFSLSKSAIDALAEQAREIAQSARAAIALAT